MFILIGIGSLNQRRLLYSRFALKWSAHESHSNAGFRSRATSLGILKNRDKVCDKVEKAQAKAGDAWR